MTQHILDEVCHVGGYSNKSNIELEFIPRLMAFGQGEMSANSLRVSSNGITRIPGCFATFG